MFVPSTYKEMMALNTPTGGYIIFLKVSPYSIPFLFAAYMRLTSYFVPFACFEVDDHEVLRNFKPDVITYRSESETSRVGEEYMAKFRNGSTKTAKVAQFVLKLLEQGYFQQEFDEYPESENTISDDVDKLSPYFRSKSITAAENDWLYKVANAEANLESRRLVTHLLIFALI